jgi:hypothetical protein
VLGVRLALPAALARVLPWASERYLDAPARVSSVELDLLRGEIALSGLLVGAPASEVEPDALRAATAWLRGERVSVRLAWRDLLQRRVRLHALVLDGPGVRLVRKADGSIDPLAAGDAAPAPEAEPEAETATHPPPEDEPSDDGWEIVLEKLVLRRPGLALDDATAPDLELVHVAADEISLDGLHLRGDTIALGGIDVTAPVVRVRQEMMGGGGGAAAAVAEPEAAGAAGAAAPAEPEADPVAALALPEDPGAAQAEAPAAPEEADPPAAAAQATDTDDEAQSVGALAGTRIERLTIEAAKVTWLGPGGPLELRIALEAEDVRAAPASAFPVRLDLGVGDGEIEAAGRLGLDPLAFEGRLRWEDVPVPFVLASAAPELLPWLRSSSGAGALELRLGPAGDGPEGAVELRAAGHTSLRDVSFADPDEREVVFDLASLDVEVEALRVRLGTESPAAADGPAIAIELGRVSAAQPRLLYARPTPALDALLAGSGTEAEPSTEAPPGNGLSLAIAALELTRGRLELRDAGVEPAFAAALTSLTLEARDVRWPERSAESVSLRAVAPGSAPLRLDGALGGEDAQASLAVERLALLPFEAYAAGATGYRPRGGSASLEIEAKVTGSRIALGNSLVLHQLDVDAVDPGLFARRFGVSLDLALALLRDRRGDVRLRAPLAFDAGRGGVDLAAVVTSGLRQALVSAMNAPLRVLGTVVPTGRAAQTGEIDLTLPSAPGSAQTRAESPPFPALARLLAERPGLALVLRGRAGPEDRDPLAEALLAERVAAGEDLPEVPNASSSARRRVADALAERGRGEPGALDPEGAAVLRRMVEAVDVPAAHLAALAARRAEWAREASLAAGIDAARATLAEPEVPAAPGVLIELVPRAD